MKFFVTRWALTLSRGIEVVDAELKNEKAICTKDGVWIGRPYWHFTYREAVQHAKHMQKCKIASLRRQIKNIQALDFKEGDYKE